MKTTNLFGLKAFSILIICISLSVSGANAQDNADSKTYGIKYFDVSKSAVMVKHDYGANITCFALDGGLYFIDTGLNTELAAKFRKEMEKKFNKKTAALILTHAHIDHFLGMGAFSDVKVVAASSSKARFDQMLKIEFNEQRIEAFTRVFPKFKESIGTAKPFLPTVWVDKEMTFGSQGNQLIFVNTGGHSSCSSYIYYAPEGVLAAGDLVQVDQYVYFGEPDTDLKKWIDTLKEWHAMKINKICPGHGKVVDKGYLPPIWEYFENMIAALKKLKEKKMSIPEVVSHPDLPKGYWGDTVPKPRWYDMCIASLYKKL